MVAGGPQILVYTTLEGSVGAFAPFVSQDDVDFFQAMEMHMRIEAPPLCGRDHSAYRSAFLPVKVSTLPLVILLVDGDSSVSIDVYE